MAQIRKIRLQSDLDVVKQFCTSSPPCKGKNCDSLKYPVLIISCDSIGVYQRVVRATVP